MAGSAEELARKIENLLEEYGAGLFSSKYTDELTVYINGSEDEAIVTPRI